MSPKDIAIPALGLNRALTDFPPPWAVAWGDDRFGLWAELEVSGVVQRLRWIEPGEFTMGSPDTDDWAFDDEQPAHRVRLIAGFWLADTACTQALWLAVTGSTNPSKFTDDPANPVDQVSWDDARVLFLNTLQQRWTERAPAALPTEAEWEYACRAGSDARFFFGDGVRTDQVNFNGKAIYSDDHATLGEDRKRTAPVKSLPPNAWGLYEMHGNVWEWCADGAPGLSKLSPYPIPRADEWSENPICLPEVGAETYRVIRGGSWFNDARSVRSANREASLRAGRSGATGFRFALRTCSPVPAAPGPEGPGA